MNLELNLRFPDPQHVIVRLDEDGDHDESAALPFRGPLAEPDQQDLQWYLEVKHGGGNLVAAIHRLLDGEQDEEALGEGLNFQEWMIIHAILQGIADPARLQALLADAQ